MGHHRMIKCSRVNTGFTVLEVVIAIFIFGCVSAALFQLMVQTDKIRGRAVYLEQCTRLAASEAERLRSIAAQSVPVEDSSYTATYGGRTFTVKRRCKEDDTPPSFIPTAREPAAVEITVVDENDTRQTPLSFKLLIGQENP
jgi:type II secretory pathway pseudopilin PulG